MKINIISTGPFEREAKKLAKKYKSFFSDLKEFENELLLNPNVGTDIGGGIRKIRVSIKSKGKGKSGGARIITYNVIINISEKNIFLLSIYDKSEKDSVSDKEIKDMLNRIKN